MRIACLAWGSLLWKCEPLVLASPWRDDGPWLPIEFVRESDGGELATALCPGAPDVRVHWALLASTDIGTARELLRQREEIPANRPDGIGGAWIGSAHVDAGPFDGTIIDWAIRQPLDAVIWTALPARSHGIEARVPSADEACEYLDGLRGEVRDHAERYVRCIPPSMRTRYRAVIERRLGWTPRATAAGEESA